MRLTPTLTLTQTALTNAIGNHLGAGRVDEAKRLAVRAPARTLTLTLTLTLALILTRSSSR